MTIKSFLKFVEIQTKLASVFPFLLGTVYGYYRFGEFHSARFIVLFLSLISFDMATTGINNYIDFKTAEKRDGYNYNEHNAMGKYQILPATARRVIGLLLCIAVFFGCVLFFMTNVVVLALGVFSFVTGICYTFGPAPISRTPFGEAVSGGIMGFVGVFLAAYVHVGDGALVSAVLRDGQFLLSFNLQELFALALFAAPTAFSIANIMLANNLCDMADDLVNQRKTLPIWIGRENALKLYAAFYAAAYLSVVATVLVGVLPVYYLGGLLSAAIVFKNVRIFLARQEKSETFVLSVKNFVLINGLNLLMLLTAVVFKTIKLLS